MARCGLELGPRLRDLAAGCERHDREHVPCDDALLVACPLGLVAKPAGDLETPGERVGSEDRVALRVECVRERGGFARATGERNRLSAKGLAAIASVLVAQSPGEPGQDTRAQL